MDRLLRIRVSGGLIHNASDRWSTVLRIARWPSCPRQVGQGLGGVTNLKKRTCARRAFPKRYHARRAHQRALYLSEFNAEGYRVIPGCPM
jgi:hypothetical protein